MPTDPRLRIPLAAALATFVLHALANPHYGFFRDELYFIICGQHPQFGYVDQPPVVPLIAAGSQIFGHSLFLLRLTAAFFAAASVYVTCLLVLEFAGGTFAMAFAALAAALCPVLAAFGEKVGPDMVGLWLWPLAALYVVRIVKGGSPRLWLAVGVALGISVESKYSVIFFAVALLAGLLLARERRVLGSPWFAAGMAVAVLIGLPNFLWQAAYGFPMWELLRNAQIEHKNVVLTPLQYVFAEIVITNPLLAIVWICGLAWLLVRPAFRFLAYGYVLLIALMIASHGKHYYPADVYPVLFAAGGAAIASWTARALWIRPAAVALTIAAGALLLPYVEPILPEQQFIAYNKAVGPKLGMSAIATEHNKPTWITQDWADMHGWPQLAGTVARVYDSLSPQDRARAVIVASNYGEASAIAFFGQGRGLPPVLSGHNQYSLWGTHGAAGDVIIDVNGDCGASMHLFRQSTRAATFSAPYIMPYEDDLPIMVCRGITKPLATIWPHVKHYI